MLTLSPNCTFPDTTPSGLVKEPNIRSTFNIVWTCTSIIILSTWSVLHLTVPPDLKTENKRQWLRKQLYLLGRKMAWMGVMLAFPEYLVGISATQLFACWINTPELKEMAAADGVPWSLSHTILANLGGIALRFAEPYPEERIKRLRYTQSEPVHLATSKPTTEEVELFPPVRDAEAGTAHSDQSTRNEFVLERPLPADIPEFLVTFQQKQAKHLAGLGKIPWRPFGPHLLLAAKAPAENRTAAEEILTSQDQYRKNHIAPLQGNIWVLDSKQLAIARKEGVIPRLPLLEKNDIQDRSKSDGLVRTIALLQVLWLMTQLVVRSVEKIEYSALEVSTLAFAACALIVYSVEWHKPKDVGVPIYIDTDVTVSSNAFGLIAKAAPISFLQPRRYYMPQSVVHQVFEGRWKKKHVDGMMIFTSIASILLFGGLHLIAWSIKFPTDTEKYIWRASALTVAVAPTVSALLVLLESVLFNRTDRLSKWSVLFLAPLYVSARLFIIVESYRSLYYLPKDAFVSTWAANAPHIG